MERWISFDCFGTLVDWNGGFLAILEDIADRRAEEWLQAYHRHERIVQREQYRSYRDVTAIALERAAREIALPLMAGDSETLSRRWGMLPVFPDTAPALRSLRDDGWRLAVLTNCDDDLFDRTRQSLGVPIDLVVTAQQVRSYKPEHAHFLRFREIASPTHWVHAACSWFHDIEPARELGITRVWIDRDKTGEDPAAATAVLPNLVDLPEILKGSDTL